MKTGRGTGLVMMAIVVSAVAQAGIAPAQDDWLDETTWEQETTTEGTTAEGPKAHIHGTFENQVTGMVLRRYSGGLGTAVYNGTRLRVDLDADLPGGLKLRSDGVARLFVGETELHLKDLLPKKTLTDLIARDPRWIIALEETYVLENECYIDNVYLKIPLGKSLIILGKQPLEQGAGYAWNPTDVFTDKDMFDPTYEKEGVISLRAVIPFGDRVSLDLIGVPDGAFEKWTGGGRISARLGPLSISGAGFVTEVSQTDVEGSMDAMAAAVVQGQDPDQVLQPVNSRRIMAGGDAVLDIAGVRLWAEGAFNAVKHKPGAPNDWWELVAGSEYFFPSETHVMIEYYHYGRGPHQHSASYGFNDWMGLLAMDLKMLGKDFLFESIDHPIADFWTIGLSSFQGLSDASAAVLADVRWAFAQDAELWALASITAGEPEDFLSAARAQAWLRLKAYF
ncbi:MAG: hypothetical protein QNJ97_11270 [Myxococcota bacterium]|nr:hypothetical protein [Myxococcota bacterium]